MTTLYTIEPYNEEATLYDVWKNGSTVCFTGTLEKCQVISASLSE